MAYYDAYSNQWTVSEAHIIEMVGRADIARFVEFMNCRSNNGVEYYVTKAEASEHARQGRMEFF